MQDEREECIGKGSVSSSIHCLCGLLAKTFVCRHFHSPSKWQQQRQTKRPHVQGMLDETDPLRICKEQKHKNVLF